MSRITRRHFITIGAGAACASALPLRMLAYQYDKTMSENQHFDVIIIGGSYSGLAAGMALGRSLRRVLIVDGGRPCNRQTPYSHNFITQDGVPPHQIAAIARQQVERYTTVEFLNGLVTDITATDTGFDLHVDQRLGFSAKKIVFATGIKDLLPPIKSIDACWGISVLHCPYCHGYEVRDETTGVLANGDHGFELARLISNWTKNLTMFTNGPSTLTTEQAEKLRQHDIQIMETAITELKHADGQLHHMHFSGGSVRAITAVYTHAPFEQHCPLPRSLGCEFTEEGYIKVDPLQRTTVPGIYACGDSTTRLRTVANAVSSGTTAGMMLNKDLITEEF